MENTHLYKLYFKGLISNELAINGIKAGFGIAIFDHKDNLFYKTKGQIYNPENITPIEAEIRALIRGLDEALSLRINHISIFSDCDQIFNYGLSNPKEKNIALLMDDVKLIIRKRFWYSKPFMTFEKDVGFAYKLAMESLPLFPCRQRQAKEVKKETCVICLDDIDLALMFVVDECGHQFCLTCVKQYIEVKLLKQKIPNCLQHCCKSKLSFVSCEKLLTPKLSLMWRQRIREDSIPFEQRIYCPYRRCSYMISKSELFTFSEHGFRRCFKCSRSFCVHCKVRWHNTLSCTDYRKLHPHLQNDDEKLMSLADSYGWKQCCKCRHMVELSDGCIRITCRCGNVFCYICGAEWYDDNGHVVCLYPVGNEFPLRINELVSGALFLVILIVFCVCFVKFLG